LKDKSLAGKAALFDVTVLEASTRTLPEVNDEFAEKVRSGLTAESLKDELRKAVDSEDAKGFKPARNAAIAKALAEVLEVDVPDTLVTNQAREKFAMMMTDMRNSGVSDEEIKKQIKPENFLKYKKIVKDDIVKDFKVSMAADEIGRMEEIEVPDYQVEEQMEAIKQDAADSKDEFDEVQIRSRVASTLQREAVMDFLADNADLEIEFTEEEEFDEALMEGLADEALKREEEVESEEGESPVGTVASELESVDPESEPDVVAKAPEPKPEAVAKVETPERDYASMSVEEKAYYSLLDSGALN
jgi:trigger factor